MTEDFKENDFDSKNVAASIDLAIIDTQLGITASGTTNLSQTLYQKPSNERDYNASKLITQKNEAIRQLEHDLPGVVHRSLENPGSLEQFRKGNLIIVMHSNFYGSALGGDVQQANLTFIQEWNQVKNDIDLEKLKSEFEDAINKLQKDASEESHFTDLANITFARNELNKADGPAMLKYLRKVGEFGVDIIKSLSSSILLQSIMGG